MGVTLSLHHWCNSDLLWLPTMTAKLGREGNNNIEWFIGESKKTDRSAHTHTHTYKHDYAIQSMTY